MNNTKAFEAAKAVNRLLEFSVEDQESLLEVIQDYFTMPDEREDESSDDDDDDDDYGEGKF